MWSAGCHSRRHGDRLAHPFWANPGSKDARLLSTEHRMTLLSRSVMPLFEYRCSRWPPQRQVAEELDRVQRKIVSVILQLPREPGEDADRYVRRRGRIAARHCRKHGLWSTRWFNRAVKWDQHLARAHNPNIWATKLRSFRDREWFIIRRSMFAPSIASPSSQASCIAGRTETRAYRGCVHCRWHDGIQYARNSQSPL